MRPTQFFIFHLVKMIFFYIAKMTFYELRSRFMWLGLILFGQVDFFRGQGNLYVVNIPFYVAKISYYVVENMLFMVPRFI